MPTYLLGQHCLHLTFKPYVSSETYSLKYKKLPNVVIHACKILHKKGICWKCVARKIGFVYLRFRLIASEQLNSLTTIYTLSWLGGVVVTHPLWVQLWVQEVLGSIPAPGKGFYVWFSVSLLLCFYFLSINTLFVTKFCKSFCNVNLFSILNILPDLWLIIRVKRYRPSIFNIFYMRYRISRTCFQRYMIQALFLTKNPCAYIRGTSV